MKDTKSDNIIDFPERNITDIDKNSIMLEAASWLIKLDGINEPSPEIIVELRQWLAQDPKHMVALKKYSKTWKQMNILTELAVPLTKHENKKHRKYPKLFTYPAFNFLPIIRKAMPMALSMTFMAILFIFGMQYFPELRVISNTENEVVYATEIGEQESIVLPDGSSLLLNTNSQIIVDYNSTTRDIRLLKGEAEFTVADNPDRPFRVYVGNQRIEALGTAFTIYINESQNKIDITVTEGRVTLATLETIDLNGLEIDSTPLGINEQLRSRVTNSDSYIEILNNLRAGQSASMNSNTLAQDQLSAIDTIEIVEEQDIAKRLSWRQGLLIFSGEPLEEVIREISRYTTVSIEILDPEVNTIRIGGQFPVGETDALLDALETNFGLRVTRLSVDHVILSANN